MPQLFHQNGLPFGRPFLQHVDHGISADIRRWWIVVAFDKLAAANHCSGSLGRHLGCLSKGIGTPCVAVGLPYLNTHLLFLLHIIISSYLLLAFLRMSRHGATLILEVTELFVFVCIALRHLPFPAPSFINDYDFGQPVRIEVCFPQSGSVEWAPSMINDSSIYFLGQVPCASKPRFG